MTFALGILPVLLLLLGFPIFVVLLASASVALMFFMHMPLAALHQNLFGSINAFPLLAIPFFVYAGELMGRGSVAQRLVDFVQGGVGSVRGSLAVTTVGTSAIFGAISGVSAACVAAIGRIMYPAMRRDGYPEHFAAGLVTAVGAIDIIIPPSIPMIVYGASAEESVQRLYAAGVVPGLMLAMMLAAYVMWFAWRNGIGSGAAFNLRHFWHGTVRGVWALGMPFIILGGIYGGIFSPTEAAAVACVYWRPSSHGSFSTNSAGRTSSRLPRSRSCSRRGFLIIVACAGVFSWLLTVNQVPAAIVGWLQSLNISAWMFLLTINVILLGDRLFPRSAVGDLVVNAAAGAAGEILGIDTVHFGIVVTVNLAIGLFHPPFGINIFVAQSVLGLDLKAIYRGIIPFLVIYLIRACVDHLHPGDLARRHAVAARSLVADFFAL